MHKKIALGNNSVFDVQFNICYFLHFKYYQILDENMFSFSITIFLVNLQSNTLFSFEDICII
jgi:hypothetical protein